MRKRPSVVAAIIGTGFLALSFVAGCSKAPTDSGISEQIKAQMFSDAALKDSSLQVAVKDGQVTLTGSVPDDAAHLEAYKIATQTPGVKKVDDQVQVQTSEAQSAEAQTPPPAPEAAPAEPPATPEPAHRKRTKKQDVESQQEPSDVASYEPPPPPQPEPEQQPAPEAAPPPQPVAPPQPPPPPPPPQPKQVQIASGTTVTIRMIDSVDSKVNHAGEIFHASLENPLISGNEVIVPKGADVYVRLSDASSAGDIKGKSALHLELVKMDFQGRSYTLTSSTYKVEGASQGKRTAEGVGGGAALGALLGAVIGGGRGAAIGAGVGAGGGGIYSGATKKGVRVPSETKIDFQLEAPVQITYMPHTNLAATPAQ